MAELAKQKAIRNVSTSFLDKGLSAYLKVDRDTAARFGVTAATIDNALYDSFGQRIISTIFTQSNQYRVILEADPKLQNSVQSLNDIYLPTAGGGQVPLSAIAKVEQRTDAAADRPSGAVPLGHLLLRRGAGLFAGRGGGCHPGRPRPTAGTPPGITTQFEGSALAFQSALANEVLLILAAIVTVYIVLGVLYESFIHPGDHPVHPAVGGRGRAAGADRHRP